ncbi:MAG: S-layer homology domain-containing protein [Thermoleophilia bacterium]|nr:S-layer homology domain-containing protein [Thermoleophilia bacterium]
MSLKSVLSTSMQVGRRKRLLVNLSVAAIIVVALTASLGSLALAASSFPDVPSTNPYYAAITDLADRGIISGKTDGKFYPGDAVTRQQFAKMIVGTGGYPVSEANVCPFGDVEVGGPSDLYPDNYVAVCAANGITLGKTETTFDPTGNITRYQVISMVVRTADNLQPGLLAPAPAGFGAWSGDPTHGANAARAEHNGLLAGLDLASLSPLGNMTRGEVAQVLHNLLVKLGTSPGTTGSTVPGATYTLTVSVAGTGSGTVAKIPDQTTFAAGSTVVLTATAATGSVFMGWSGDASGDTNPLTVTMNSNKTIVATFNAGTAQYALSTSVPEGGGTVAKSPDQALYPSGSSVVLTAVPTAGRVFTGWTGDASGTTNPLTVVMNSHKSIAAHFATAYTLSTSVNPAGKGTIAKSPDKSAYTAGETVTLTATPTSGYVFHHWGGGVTGTANPTTVTMNANKTVTAFFVPAPTYTLTINISGGGTSTVTKSPNKTSYTSGETVTLTANPAAGYKFSYWSGDLIGVTNPKSLVMDANKTVYAHFEALPTYSLSLYYVGGGASRVDRSPQKTKYYEGETVTLTANPARGYKFSYWSGDLIGVSNPKSLVMDSDKSVYAHFEALAVRTLTINIYGEGSVVRNPIGTLYDGDTVTLWADPDPGWHFVRWWGSIAGTSNPATFTMNANKAVNVTFERD